MKTKKPTKLAALIAGVALASFADDLALDNEAKTVSEAADATVEYGAVTLASAASLSVASGTFSAASISAGNTSNDNSISVTGPDAALSFTSFSLGNTGCGNSISVSGGAKLTQNGTSNKEVLAVGLGNTRDLTRGCDNAITISGEGTTAALNYVTLGTSGCNNTLRIKDGAEATVAFGVACGSLNRPGTNNHVVVENATLSFTRANANNVYGFTAINEGSQLQVIGGDVHVSAGISVAKGAGVSLSDGATLDPIGTVAIGSSAGGEACISIDGSEFLATNAQSVVTVGDSSPSNTLYVSNGGLFKSTGAVNYGNRESQLVSDFSSIVVTGEGSVFSANTVNVGYGVSRYGSFTVKDGAALNTAYFNNVGDASNTTYSNRLEVVDGAVANIHTYCHDNAVKSYTNNFITVRDATLNFANTFNWSRGATLRIEGTRTKVSWPAIRGRGAGSPLSGAVLEFVPPASARTFDEPPINVSATRSDAGFSLNYGGVNPLTLRVVDAKDCIKAGGGKYPLLRHTYEIQGSLDDVALDAPDGVALSLSDDKKTLWVTIPGPGGFRVIIR